MLVTKPLKFDNNASQKCYFWGCTHVFHDPQWEVPLWKSRGFSSIEDHAEHIKNTINTTCTENDTLFLLGDGFLSSTPEQVKSFLYSLKPKIQYIWGNHESSTTRIYKEIRDEQYGKLFITENIEIYPLRNKNITFWGNYLEININGQCMTLSHYPFKVWNNSKIGYWSIHSHNHGSLPSSTPEANEGKILDVGVDLFINSPVSFEQLKQIMAKKDKKTFDKHH